MKVKVFIGIADCGAKYPAQAADFVDAIVDTDDEITDILEQGRNLVMRRLEELEDTYES